MRYKSNLTAPDLRPHFKLLDPPMQRAGHDAPSDPDFEPECTFWTDDEAAILYNVAAHSALGGDLGSEWIDIGCRFGWTAKHINWITNGRVICVDPSLAIRERRERFFQNMGNSWGPWLHISTSAEFFARDSWDHDGFVIDGDHDAPQPLLDAIRCHTHAKKCAVIMLHDFMGAPVRDATAWLMNHGWHCRVYWTPNGVACCWRGEGFRPPDHVPDPAIDWAAHKRSMVDFEKYWERCK